MGGWVYADVWETIADSEPSAPALIHGDRRLTWGELDHRADGVARALLDSGALHQDRVATYLHNSPEYLISVLAALKAGLVPVNTNYRYGPDELAYLWNDADAVAVVFHGTFTERVAQVRSRVPAVHTWLWVDDGTAACPAWAVPFGDAAGTGQPRVRAPWGRHGDDLVIIYTGGTTGRPKGVMWRQHDMYRVFDTQNDPAEPGLGAVARRAVTRPRPIGLPAPPLMHSTGLMFAFTLLNQGGCIVTLPSHHFDAVEMFDTIERERVNVIAIVGDAFAAPMIEALDGNPRRWELACLELVASAGVMLSASSKQHLLDHIPDTVIIDILGATEAYGMGMEVSSSERRGTTAHFRMGRNTTVLADDGREVVPGSGEVGRLAVRGPGPIGYHKDPEASAATFREIGGERYSVPGDWAMVEADGSITLLGRGSVCINTGGEKVFPEEVEEALKLHPAVRDAAVVGVPDDRFGESVTAIVELVSVVEPGEVVESGIEVGAADRIKDELVGLVRQRLAHYKAPRHILVVDSLGRGPNGKADYRGLRRQAMASLGIDDPT